MMETKARLTKEAKDILNDWVQVVKNKSIACADRRTGRNWHLLFWSHIVNF